MGVATRWRKSVKRSCPNRDFGPLPGVAGSVAV